MTVLAAVRATLALVAALAIGCEPGAAEIGRPASAPLPTTSARDEWIGAAPVEAAPAPAPPRPESGEGQDFAEEVKLLHRVAACGSDGPLPPHLDAAVIRAHCDEIRPKIEAYKKRYVAVARPFLAALAPAGLPDKVVYPFGGGDLVTALTTYPDAREITTLSLELVGDPRRVRTLGRASLEASLRRLRGELGELLFVDDYSRSETLKKTQRGDLPGELALFLVGLSIHGFEPVSLRYFTLRPDGSIHYLDEREIQGADHVLARSRKATWIPPDFAESFANAEIGFRRSGAPDEPPRLHRHLAQNLADEPLQKAPAVLRHLGDKGQVAAMTKAASYLLWQDGFSSVRGYLLTHAAFMISDSTGIPPSFARSAGFTQETYGVFRGSLLRGSPAHNQDFRRLWGSQPRRKLPFRYGYLSQREAHLVVMKRAPR